MKIYCGFSLIEVAIVLLVIGLLTTGFIVPFTVQMDVQKIKQTDKTLEKIKEALLGFALINGRLPCPALDKGGSEDCTLSDREGFLPWRVLGIGRYDEWGNTFLYRVDENYMIDIFDNDFKTASDLKLRNITDTFDWTANETETTTSRIAAIVISYGKQEKPDNGNKTIHYADGDDATYVNDIHNESDDPTKYFDDRLIWLSKYTVMNRLLLADKLPL